MMGWGGRRRWSALLTYWADACVADFTWQAPALITERADVTLVTLVTLGVGAGVLLDIQEGVALFTY